LNGKEFSYFRKRLGKTQEKMAQLLGTSVKAIQSYEQGWRTIPPHAERQVFFLFSRMRGNKINLKSCWIIKECPPERKKICPAWEFRAGRLCWFINGTVCQGIVQRSWKKKMSLCRKCEVLLSLLKLKD